MTRNLDAMLDVLRCPLSGTRLHSDGRRLVSERGDYYPIVDGKPVLVRQITELNIKPPHDDIVSQNIPAYVVPPDVDGADALVLHHGSGNVPSDDPRVVSFDVLPCANVDVVGEAEALPFADGTFAYVESGAVFEHLHDPLAAIGEIRRVLEPGGRVRIDTAFLQGYHGYPGHYFNLTPQAIETFLVDDFDLELATVPDSATPVHTVLDLLERFLALVPAARREELLAKPFQEVVDVLAADETRQNRLLVAFDEHALRALAASFVVVARKPDAYEDQMRKRLSEGAAAAEAWRALKREYYTARTGLIFRHHQVGLQRRFARDAGRDRPNLKEPEPLEDMLERCRPASMFDTEALRAAIDCLGAYEKELARLRDKWTPTARGRSLAERVARKVRPTRRGG